MATYAQIRWPFLGFKPGQRVPIEDIPSSFRSHNYLVQVNIEEVPGILKMGKGAKGPATKEQGKPPGDFEAVNEAIAEAIEGTH